MNNKNKIRPSALNRYIASSFVIAILISAFPINKANAFVYHVPVDAILAIDRSGSMSSALSSEKTAANAFIDKMDATQDQVGVVAFDNSGSLQQLSNNFATVKSYVNSISSGGGTSYLAGLNSAESELSSVRHRAGAMPVIVFMSDGSPSESESTITTKTNALKASGIQIFTIYLGSGSPDILKKMASSSAGTDDHYFNAPSAADLAQIYTEIANLLQTPNEVYIGTKTGDLTLQASDLSPNKTIILKVSGTVTIAGNQTNNPNNSGAKYIDISQLSQLVIIANKIVINGNVTNVDAWLIAKDTIQTCDDTSTPTINKCTNKLTVNGPVMAKHLNLLRTAGSGVGSASNDPAEVFNLRADAYLWAAAHSVSFGRAQTVSTVELPPRF